MGKIKTDKRVAFIIAYLKENGLANLKTRKSVYSYIKKDKPELTVMNPNGFWYKRIFNAYIQYLQAPAEQKERIIKTFVAYREERLESIQRRRAQRKENPNTTNGETSEQSKYSRQNALILYKSPEWQKLRYFVLKRDNGVCQLCGRGRKDGVVLHVDHIVPLSVDWSKRLDPNNLQTLCEDCNLGKSNKDCIDWR